MITLKGKFNEAKVFNNSLESSARNQILEFLNNKSFENGKIRIMPDVHAGAGAVIGFTAPLKDRIIPNVIGVDIGCGVYAYRLGHSSEIGEKFKELDQFIRKNIPSGKNVCENFSNLPLSGYLGTVHECEDFFDQVIRVCKKTNQGSSRVLSSIGSLGGGNHFIEVDKDEDGFLWLVVHSGSRNFGLKVALFHQKVAESNVSEKVKSEIDDAIREVKERMSGKDLGEAIKEIKSRRENISAPKGLEFLDGSSAESYKEDMDVAQKFAHYNRMVMIGRIVEGFYNLKLSENNLYKSVHNYINFEDGIIRKGAISAHKGEKVVIPLNMADGTIIGIGKGNEDWNNSAPHGAGRVLSRSKAKKELEIEDFKKRMCEAGVWSSCVCQETLDESPMAYKNAESIIGYLEPTVDIQHHMKPVYNFKAN